MEEVTADLVSNGWGEEDAAEIVEEQRQATRRQRGVVTRDDVAYVAERRYRKSTRRIWFVVMITFFVVFFFGFFSGYLSHIVKALRF